MTQWVFDLGNSRMKCAPLRADGRLGEVRALGYGDDVAGARDDAIPAAVTGEAASAGLASVASPSRTAAAGRGSGRSRAGRTSRRSSPGISPSPLPPLPRAGEGKCRPATRP